MTYQPETGDGAHALDAHQFTNALLGNLVASGAAISVGSGTREVDAASGTVVVAGTAHSISSQDPAATLDAATTHPRKDTIYVDNTGSIAVAKGTEEALDPLGTSSPVEDTVAPNPPDLSGVTGTVLAVALVETDDTVTLQDRRQVGRIPNPIVGGFQNFGASDAFSAYPIEAADIATDAVGSAEIAAAAVGSSELDEADVDAADFAGGSGLANQYLQTDGALAAWATIQHSHLGGVTADQHHAQDHASRHHDGGPDEIDAAQLAGALGTTGQVLQTDGSAASWVDSSGGITVTEDIFTTSGTWNKPSGISWVLVDVISGGGGGGGSGSTGQAGGGGGSGGTRRRALFPADEVGSSETVTVGAGGAGKSAFDASGDDGGESSFGSLVSAPGGNGGGDAGSGTTSSPGDSPWSGGQGGGDQSDGGNSLYGPGGGGGGSSDDSNNAGAAGAHGIEVGSGDGTDGAAGTETPDIGGAGDGGAGGNLNHGGVPGGGGGGANDGSNTGGDGGRGEVRVWSW